MKNLLYSLCIITGLTAMGQTQFQQEAVGSLTFTKERISQLANAMPDEKYTWSPSDGVRNFASVIGHVISANYFFGMKLGGKLPTGIDPMTIEKNLTTKQELVAALDQSHDFVIGAINGLKESEMGDKVEVPFPGEFTKMSMVNVAMNHASEHMGQLIAYVRSNGVTPPWSVAPGE